jgi:hypothetical protein
LKLAVAVGVGSANTPPEKQSADAAIVADHANDRERTKPRRPAY